MPFNFCSVSSSGRTFWDASNPCPSCADVWLFIFRFSLLLSCSIYDFFEGVAVPTAEGFWMGTLTPLPTRISATSITAALTLISTPTPISTPPAHHFPNANMLLPTKWRRRRHPLSTWILMLARTRMLVILPSRCWRPLFWGRFLLYLNLTRGNAPSVEVFKPFSPLVLDGKVGTLRSKSKRAPTPITPIPIQSAHASGPRRRVAWHWGGRRGALGLLLVGNAGIKKFSTTTSTDQKENLIVVVGSVRGLRWRALSFPFSLCFLSGIRVIDLRNCRPGDRPTPRGRSVVAATPGPQLRPRSGTGFEFLSKSNLVSFCSSRLHFRFLFHRNTPNHPLRYAMPYAPYSRLSVYRYPPQNTRKIADAAVIWYLSRLTLMVLSVHGFVPSYFALQGPQTLRLQCKLFTQASSHTTFCAFTPSSHSCILINANANA